MVWLMALFLGGGKGTIAKKETIVKKGTIEKKEAIAKKDAKDKIFYFRSKIFLLVSNCVKVILF